MTTTRVIDVAANGTYPVSPTGLLIDDNILYVADEFAGIVFRQPID